MFDVDAYLERIGYRGGREPTAANLAALVRAHRLAVPYETLDLWRGRTTTLAIDELFDKVVTRRRGGYCFELNGLFAALLRALGYSVREYFGRWLYEEDPSQVPKRRHRVICVALAGLPNQIVDVGTGLPLPLAPLDLVFNVPQVRDARRYRVLRDPVLSCVVEARTAKGWARLFSFDTAPELPVDFEYAHWWCQTHPGSKFRTGLLVSLPHEGGGATVISTETDPARGPGAKPVLCLAEFDGRGQMTKTELHGDAELAAALRERFGIVEQPTAADVRRCDFGIMGANET